MRFITATLLLFLSFSATAANYYWYAKGTNGQVQYPSPRAACDAQLVGWKQQYPQGFEQWIVQDSDVQWRCRFKSSPSGSNFQEWTWIRAGDSCNAGGVYNTGTGACDYPSPDAGKKCADPDAPGGLVKIINTGGVCVRMTDADQPALCKYLGDQGTKAVNFYISFTQDGNPQMPPSPEIMGCKVKIMSVADCKLPAAKSTGGITLAPAQVARCRVGAYFTGEVAGSGTMAQASPSGGTDGVCGEAQDCTPPDEPKVQEQKPCNYVLDGEGRKVCSSSNFTGDPGSMDCGSVNGSFTCITRPSKSTGQMTDTKIETKANADGSTTTTKTDTITQITCGGAGSCVSTTTKVSQVTSKDGNGNTTGNSTSCTGPKCATSTNPDGNGDGLGDCTGDDCGKGAPSVGKLTKPESGSFDGMGEEWDQKIADAKKELLDKVDQLKTAFNPIGQVSLSSGGNLYCADAPEILGKKFDACVSVYDEQLSWISLAILVACACIALCIVFI